MASRALIFCLLYCVPGQLLCAAQTQPLQITQPLEQVRSEIPYRDGTVVLLSDFQERVTRTRYRASGHVRVTFQDMLITCDEAEYDEATRDGWAKGNIRFSQGKQWFSCSRAEFNFENQTATFHDASGFTDQEFLVRGRTVVKTGRDTYHVRSGFVSTCQERRPKWSFATTSATIKVDRTTRLRHTVFRIKGVPIFYFPYMIVPMEQKKRSSGFVPFHMGKSTSKGRVFSEGWFQTLGRSADATIYGDYFSLRGLAIGGIFRARPNPATRLHIEAYGINDRLGQGGAQLFVDAVSQLPRDFRFVARANVTSNFRFRQAFADTFRAATIPQEESIAFLTRNLGSWSTDFSFQREEVLYPSRSVVIRKSPSLELFSLGKPLGNLPLIFSLRASADGMSRVDNEIESPKMVQRLDLYPRLALRLPELAGFSLIPSIGARETFYSAGLASGPDREVSVRHISRHYTDFELDLRVPTLQREFWGSSDRRFTHVLEPNLKYRRIHGIKDRLDEVIRFDAEDPISDTNEVEYGLVNRIIRTRRTSSGSAQPYEFFSLSIVQKQYFDPDFGGAFKPGEANIFYPLYTTTGFAAAAIVRNFAPTNVIARVTPQPGITLDARADFDTKLNSLRDASLTTMWQQERIYIAGTWFKTSGLEQGSFNSHHVQGQVGYGRVDRGFSASVAFSYDILSSRLLNSHTRLYYVWDCCGVALEYQQYDIGLRTENRFTFSFSLKGIGSFGNLKRPESLF